MPPATVTRIFRTFAHPGGSASSRLLPARAALAIAGLTLLLGACGSAKPDASVDATARSAGLRLLRIGVFDGPTYVTGAPGDRRRLFVVQRPGVIAVLVDGRRLARPFLNIARLVATGNPEQGLLSMAFAPNYRRSGRFYVFYTDHASNLRIVEYQRSRPDADLANRASGRNVLTIDHHQYANHNGGQLEFGPDGDLYVGVGDGGNEGDPFNRGQNTHVLLGKLLRIRPRAGGGYSIPPGNPFSGRGGRRREIWAYGLRNPWRFSFDRRTGALVITDVGESEEEEVDFVRRGHGRGANYGWSIWEGYRREKPGRAPGAVFPTFVTLHSKGNCAIIGGYVVRDRSLPALYGRYVYGDLCRPQINSVRLSAGHATDNHATGLAVREMSSFGQDSLGRIYAVSLAGPVYRITQR